MVKTLAIQLVLLLLVPPLLLGVINRVKALFSGRTGPPLLQAYYDILKLMRKACVISRSTTWIFIAGPSISLAAIVFAGLLLPFGAETAAGFAGDVVLFAYLLALSRFFTTSAALDTGSAFEGMGAAREATFACFTEPVLFFALLALARISGSLKLGDMLGAPLSAAWASSAPILVLIAAGLFVLILAENCRIPFDDPNTHLELTMIHEVMVLDHSGPLLGFILYGAAIKLFIFCALLARIVLPADSGSALLDGVHLLGTTVLIAAIIGVVESVMARLRMKNVPNLLIAATVLCAFGFVLLLR